MVNIIDGHIHTPYCPHGSKDSFVNYIERAIELGYKEMTFTEHAPLPINFEDPTPDKDSGMNMDQLQAYIEDIQQLKKQYEDEITIHLGLEVDFIEGYEQDVTNFLNEWGKYLDDSLLSVHFLKCPSGRYICLDYSPKMFQELVDEFSSVKGVYEKYYETLQKSIVTDLGKYKPKRIGHITLVRKFQKKFPITFDDTPFIEDTLHLMKQGKYALDVNGAGLAKPLCKEFYPPLKWAKRAKDMGIKLVYGSDAHDAKQLGIGLEKLKEMNVL